MNGETSPVVKATRITALLILSFLFSLIVFRAVTQSVTHDEALTYQLYIASPLASIFKINNPNNHLLVTLLIRLSTALFGFSELTLRLPTVLAAALFFYTTYRLCVLLFGGGWLLVAAVALMVGNPLVLDFMVAARGYGAATAFLFYGFYCLLVYLNGNRYKWSLLYRGAMGLSFGVMSNMAVLISAFVLMVLFLMSLTPPSRPSKQPKRAKKSKRPKPAVIPPPGRFVEAAHLVTPIVALAIVFLIAMPVNANPSGGFYRIHSGFWGSVDSLVKSSVSHNDGLGGLNRDSEWLALWRKVLTYGVFPLIAVAGVIFSVWSEERSKARMALRWASGVIVGSFVFHIVGAALVKLPYPANRTGLQYFPLLGLTMALLVDVLRRTPGRVRFAAALPAVLAVCLTLHYAVQLNWTHFNIWEYDSDDKQVVRKLDSLRPAEGVRLDVGVSWQLVPSLEFYRNTGNRTWLRPFIRENIPAEHDYYVLLPQYRNLVKERNLAVLYTAPRTGVIVARKAAARL